MMNTTRQNISWYICLWLAALGTAIIVLPDLLLHPGKILLQLGGDGIKNFYAYYYHAMYGYGFHFTGMNYPVGEHIVYADGQAFLSVPLSWLRNYIHFTPAQVISILHLTIIAGYMLAVVYLGLLLRFFKTSGWFSIIFAVLIVLISPQVFRIFGHYGLSYFSVIPMLFYWTVKYHYTSLKQYTVYIFVLGTIMAFSHPYYAAVFFIWGALYVLAYIITQRGIFRSKLTHLLPYTISFTGILVVMKLVMALTDSVTDRPVEPLGILSACTTGMNIFTCKYSALWRVLDEVFKIKGVSDMDEGLTYIGLSCAIIVICSLVYITVQLFRRRKDNIIVERESVFSPVWLIIAFGSLLLAMGVPFVWHMEWLLDYLSVFRQFRSLGRFSWIFYYIITVYACVVLYHWFNAKILLGKKGIAWSVLLLCIVLWVFEASGYISHALNMQGSKATYQSEWFFSKNDQGNWEQFLAKHHYKKQDFQAVMLYPYLHVGTEKIWIDGDNMWVLTIGASAAAQMQLPIVNVVMSRSSWSQAFKNVKMVGGLLADKTYLAKVNDKPFLLIWKSENAIKPDVQCLFDASDYIGDFFDSKIYACYPSRIRALQSAYLAQFEPVIHKMALQDTVLNMTGDYYIEHFDTGKSSKILYSAGAMAAVNETYFNLPDINIAISPDSQQQAYEFSAWVLNPSDSYKGAECKLEIYDSTYNELQIVMARSKDATDFNGMWFRMSAYFTLDTKCRHIRCKICNVPVPSYKALDELQIRPVNATIISKTKNGKVLINGHIINNRKQ